MILSPSDETKHLINSANIILYVFHIVLIGKLFPFRTQKTFIECYYEPGRMPSVVVIT